MKLISDPRVKVKFNNYPRHVKTKMTRLRELVLKTANDIDGLEQLEETLKWGEPSYLTKFGIDWKAKNPAQFAIFFKCTSLLVPTFKKIYKDTFTFEKNRAIVFSLDDSLPEKEITHCISLALTYHKVKHLPLLGA